MNNNKEDGDKYSQRFPWRPNQPGGLLDMAETFTTAANFKMLCCSAVLAWTNFF